MIALRIRQYIESSSGFIMDRRDLGGPRSQRGVRKISLEVFFRTDVIDRHSLLCCHDPNLNSISIPLSAQPEMLAAASDGGDRDLFVRLAKSPLASMSADGAVCASKTLI